MVASYDPLPFSGSNCGLFFFFFNDNLAEPDNCRCSLQNTILVPEDVFHSSYSGHPKALESEHQELDMKTEGTFLTIDPAR